MPDAPSEPEKYSIDEMMSRLTAPASEDSSKGELVTRADGSQAMRVRKRKRRSSQPIKERAERNRRVRMVQVSAALILLLLAGVAIAAGVVYANSKPFRENLVAKIAQSTGAETDLNTFRMNPRTANSGKLTLNWPQGNVLETLNLRGLSAEIFPASFLGKAFSGEQIKVDEASLTLRLPSPGELKRATPASQGSLPIRFHRYRTPVFNLTLAGNDGPLLRLNRAEATFSQETVAGKPQLSLYRGDLALPGWPKLRMDRALIEFRDGQTDIIGMRLMHGSEDTGALSLSGRIAPYTADRSSSLDVGLENFQLSGLIGPDFANLISGRVDSIPSAKSNYLSFQPHPDSSPALEVAFSVSPLSGIEIRSLPFLVTLSHLLDEDDWFEKPLFDSDATGVLRRENGIISLHNLNLESKGRLILRGDLSVSANQALTGQLRVGLPDSMIPKTSPLKTIVTPAADGYEWFTLKISGTPAAPVDNFKELAGQTAKSPQAAPDTSEGSSFEELTRPDR
ncbi:MAG: hypothetical protein V4640_10765 [Verrucomicrobiota bacterium]